MKYKYQNDTGFDIYSAEDKVISPHSFGIIESAVSSEGITMPSPNSFFDETERYIVAGIALELKAKSSSDWIITGGEVDIDYNDKVYVKIANILDNELVIKEGQAICQGILRLVLQVKDAERGPRRKKTGGIKSQYHDNSDSK